MVRERHHDLARPVEVQVRADEHVLGAGAHEQVHELLRGGAVDLVRPRGAPRTPVLARVVDVGVEPVLVRRVAEPAELGAEVAAVRARQVADEHRRRIRVASARRREHAFNALHERSACPSGATPGSRRACGSGPRWRSPRRRPAAAPRARGGRAMADPRPATGERRAAGRALRRAGRGRRQRAPTHYGARRGSGPHSLSASARSTCPGWAPTKRVCGNWAATGDTATG